MGLLGHVGRPAKEVIYIDIKYCDKEYVIGHIVSNGNEYKFIFDKEDYDNVSQYSWHLTSENYVSTGIIHNNSKKLLYLHNLVMKRDSFKGKGQTESIDHVNRNGLDNRKENLRLISQSEQNINQTKKKRNVALPESCGLKSEDIPRHIWYVHQNGLHGDRFAIQFKTEGIVWKTTSSKKVDLQTKLLMAKNKLKELYDIYPHLNPDINEINRQNLLESYNKIIELSLI